ncbi:hypothetical protein B0H14DRAFT_2629673 [Mycena olivaceomarginata]|nr:hypothetical protein B0H14DRAFT_2629673 [Mycena olivaceomarginata]
MFPPAQHQHHHPLCARPDGICCPSNTRDLGRGTRLRRLRRLANLRGQVLHQDGRLRLEVWGVHGGGSFASVASWNKYSPQMRGTGQIAVCRSDVVSVDQNGACEWADMFILILPEFILDGATPAKPASANRVLRHNELVRVLQLTIVLDTASGSIKIGSKAAEDGRRK